MNTVLIEGEFCNFLLEYDFEVDPGNNQPFDPYYRTEEPREPSIEITFMRVFQVDGHNEPTGTSLDLAECDESVLVDIALNDIEEKNDG